MIRPPAISAPPGARQYRQELRVIFGDTDALGIVYYANYLRFFEAGRATLLREAGLPYGKLLEQGVIMPIVEQWWRYRTPARFDDLLVVSTWVHELARASVLVGCRIERDGELIGEGAARLACTDPQGRVQRIPPALVELAGVRA